MRFSTFQAAALLSSSLVAAAPAPEASAAADSKFTYYEMPTALAGPCDLCTGPDGAIWVQDILVDKIVRIDPDTGDVEEFDIPYDGPGLQGGPLLGIPDALLNRSALACALQPGHDGNIYAASGLRNQFSRINPTTKKIDVFTPNPVAPLGDVLFLNDLYAHPEGMFFTQTTGNALTFFDYKTEQFTPYQVPTPLALPVGVYVPEDGSVWVCEFGGQKIARFNFTDATWKEYPVPLGGLGPAVMRAETEGRYLWYTAFIGNSVGRVDMTTGEMKAFTNPSPLSFPTEDTVDSEGNVWFSTATQNTLNKLFPSTGEIQTFEQPDTIVTAPISLPLAADIAVHYGPGNAIWFTEVANNRVGRFQL